MLSEVTFGYRVGQNQIDTTTALVSELGYNCKFFQLKMKTKGLVKEEFFPWVAGNYINK